MAHWNKHWNTSRVHQEILEVWAHKFITEYEKISHFSSSDIVLDFGAGRGDVSLLLASKVAKVYLYDTSPAFQKALATRCASIPNACVINDPAVISNTVSLILVNSVIQYLSSAEVTQMFSHFRRISDQHTKIIIADILPLGYSKIPDALHLIVSGIRNGYIREFMANMISCLIFSPELSLKSSSLQMYDYTTLAEIASQEGFSCRKLPDNFTSSQLRYTIQCTVRQAA